MKMAMHGKKEIIKQYYELLLKKEDDVNLIWKYLSVLLFTFSAICGFTSAMALGRVTEVLDEHCILNTYLVIVNRTDNVTIWGDLKGCNFVTFSQVACMICATVWLGFFLIHLRGGYLIESDKFVSSHIIALPALICSVISLLVVYFSLKVFKSGMNVTCNSPDLKSCLNPAILDSVTLLYHKNQQPIVMYLKVCKIFIICNLLSWICQTIWLTCRIIFAADFHIHHVTISYKNDEEFYSDMGATNESDSYHTSSV